MDPRQLESRAQKALQNARRAVAELELVCRQQQTALSRAALREDRLREEAARQKLRAVSLHNRLQDLEGTPQKPIKHVPQFSTPGVGHIIDQIKRIVLDVCQAPPESFTDKGRKFYKQSWPRRLAMYLCYEVYRLGKTEEIAAAFHKKDHGSVCYACSSVKDDISVLTINRAQHDECRRRIEAEVKGVVAAKAS